MDREAAGLAGARHKSYDTLGSTNAEALKLARAGERGPLWITAQAQTAGRGRRGSSWVSASGNLFATLLLTEPSVPALAPQLSFVAALALHDAVSEAAPQVAQPLSLKWPNDLLLGGEKLAGILIEGDNDKAFVVAIGIGVNCASHPADTHHPATDLASAGARVAPGRLFAALAPAMERRLSQWRAGKGFAAVRADWLELAVDVGREIRVRLPELELWGLFEGLDDSGRLLIKTASGVTIISAGEVFGL